MSIFTIIMPRTYAYAAQFKYVAAAPPQITVINGPHSTWGLHNSELEKAVSRTKLPRARED